MGFNWTREQRQVIELRNRNILVSAAAGSGKTAVLVERIIGRILDKSQPVDIDKMLIVTFTNAAAAEMRERIGSAVEKALEEEPQNVHLQRQSTLVHHAQITTIHSFCLYLIRNYFHKIDLEPNFRIAEVGELNLLKEDVIADVLNQGYEKAEEGYLNFVESFATGKSDDILRQLILSLYDFAMSYPWPKEWLLTQEQDCAFENWEDVKKRPWMKKLMIYLTAIMEDMLEEALRLNRLTKASDGPGYLTAVNESDIQKLEKLMACGGYLEWADCLLNFAFDRLPSSRGYDGSQEILEAFKSGREEIKDTIKKIKTQFFFASPDDLLQRMCEMRPAAEELLHLTGTFLDAYDAKKREKNILDFNDLEHFALKILLDEETKQSTEVAEECKNLFEEIMIDEYQDSNFVQETLLNAVSRQSRGECNRFMVGDVKQSIYRFRLARPELFMEKYDSYTSADSSEQKIELHQNFRSRSQVLDFTNDIFGRIMCKDLGNVEYDENASLHPGAAFPDNLGIEAELLLADSEDELLEEADIEGKIQFEAEIVAARIRKLMREQKVVDKIGGLRSIRYSDIVILLRSFGSYADTFLDVLEQKGIPAHASSKTGYFSTTEIQTLLALLRVLDNPCQDIPLAAVMRSPIAGFTDEELAALKVAGGKRPFHLCVREFSSLELDSDLADKLAEFQAMVEEFRDMVTEKPIHELLYQMLERTGYKNYAAAMPGGIRRKANIQMLLEKAIAYEKTSYRGLFHFIRYIDRLQRYEVDYGEADIVSENENAVRLMTIHKSKGLEFPVVFLCGTGKAFNKQDSRSRMVIHPDLGIGIDFIDPKRRIRGATLGKRAIAKQMELENTGEELRVLYVALTRAKEKLIITGTKKQAAEELLKLEKSDYQENSPLTFANRAKAGSFLDWILPAVVSFGGKYEVQIIDTKQLIVEEMESQMDRRLGLLELFHLAETPDENCTQRIEEALSYQYPHEAEKNRKMKYSVSELKHRAMDIAASEEEIPSYHMFPEEDIIPYVPKFIREQAEVNRGALRGSAMHRAVECLPVERLAGSSNLSELLQTELAKLEADGRLTKEMAELIRIDKLERFYASNLAVRMKTASLKENLYREKPFVMGRSANEIEGDESDTMVLIQGIMDAFFEEDGEIVLLDYKTDVVENKEELVRRYQKQLELYQKALEGNLNKKVKQKLIYSFYLDQTIEV